MQWNVLNSLCYKFLRWPYFNILFMLDVAKEYMDGFYVGGLYMKFKTTDKQLNEWTG